MPRGRRRGGAGPRLPGSAGTPDGVRDDLRDYVAGRLGDCVAVLVFDETGDVKGTATVGVGRKYAATAGRIENAQGRGLPACASARGHTLIDRELPLPQSWTRLGRLIHEYQQFA